MKETDRSQYFQAIAHNFLSRRGAPFFLSSTDIELIRTWEKVGIPLQVVMDGIERTFESERSRSMRRHRIHSLAFCKLHVLKEFEQYRERKVGAHKRKEKRDEKRKRVKNEVRSFLMDFPPDLSHLRNIFNKAQKILSRREVKEEELERLEEKIEALLLSCYPQQEREEAKVEISQEYPSAAEEEIHSLLKIKLVKLLREKYKIPYISFFYY